MYRLRLLGGLTIEGPDGPLSGRIAQRRQLALLAVLALSGGRGMRRDKLLALLWPEVRDEQARRALSDTLYVIRAALGEHAVVTRGDEIALAPTCIRSDAADFDAALETRDLKAALDLYGGPFLDGFHLPSSSAFEHWLELERARLAESYVAALEAEAGQSEAEGHFVDAAALRRRAVAVDPLCSRRAGLYARALAKAGDPVGALHAIREHESALRDEVGVGAPIDLARLREELRRQLTEVSPPAGTRRERPRPSGGDATRRPGDVTPTPKPFRPAMRWTAAFVAVAATATLWSIRSESRVDADLAIALPFRVEGLDPSLAHLGEAMRDLMVGRLSGEEGSLRLLAPQLAGDPPFGFASTEPSSGAGALDRARSVGAGRLLLGSLVGDAHELSVQVVLLDTYEGAEVGRAAGSGTPADLEALADRLAATLMSRHAALERHRLTDATGTSLPALRAYLAGRSAQRLGDYDRALLDYGRALDADSTFALAGLGAARVSGWIGGAGPTAQRGRDAARAHADLLNSRDRARVLGPPGRDAGAPRTARSRLAEADASLRYGRDDPELWYGRGEVFLHHGGALALPNRWGEARESFQQAVGLDPGFAEAVHHLAATLAVSGDTSGLRDLVRTQLARHAQGPLADYLRWRGGTSLADGSVGVASLEDMDTDATLYWIGIEAQDTGVGLGDGATAVRLRLSRPGVREERMERRLGALAYALNEGRVTDAGAILDEIDGLSTDPHFAERLSVLTALFADGDLPRAARAADVLAGAPTMGRVGELNACVETLWRLRVAPESVERPRVLSDEEATAGDSGSWAVARRVCALVRDAQWLERVGGAEWTRAIARLDGFLGVGAIGGLVHDGHAEYAHLALARLQRRAGDASGALRSVARRSFYSGWQPYLAATLREEAALARASGDEARARRAEAHSEAFRGGLRVV